MVNRVHEILAHAPRVGLPHVCGWWNDQCQWLSVHLIVVITMPRSVHGKVVRPHLGHSVGIASSRVGLRGGDGSGHQADGEDDSMDHGRLIHQGSAGSGFNGQGGWLVAGSGELARHTQEVPINVARCLANGWVIVGSPSPIHATTAVIMSVEPILMRVQHVVWVKGLVGVVGVSHVWWNRHGGQVHLGIRSVGSALSVEVVEQVWLAVAPLNSWCDVPDVVVDGCRGGDLFCGFFGRFVCRRAGSECHADGQGDRGVGKRSDFHRFGSTVNVARACRRLKWVGIQPVGWRSIPAGFGASRMKIQATAAKVGTDPVFKRFRVKNGSQLTFASFAASLGTILGFVFTGLIGITGFCISRCSICCDRLG